jgi:hydroxymethylglutaryl-CoA lyase
MLPQRVELIEVSPRDGLQNEPEVLSTDDKIALIGRAAAAGAKRIEATSFVNPRRVPQMADAEAVMAGLPRPAGVSYIGLVLNRRGFDRALAARCDEVNYAVVATDTFSRRNQGATTEEGLKLHDEICAAARAANIPYTVTIAATFGCPFEGEVPETRIADIARRLAVGRPDEIALADTIGVAAPTAVTRLIAAVRDAAPGIPLRVHFHNTRNTGIANVYAAVEAGVTAIDASIGGIGGCPFAPAATGNVASEDVIYMLERMGVRTGVNLPALIETAKWLEGRLGRPVPAMLSRAGMFPPAAAA